MIFRVNSNSLQWAYRIWNICAKLIDPLQNVITQFGGQGQPFRVVEQDNYHVILQSITW